MATAQLRALLQHLRRIVGPQAGGLADAHLLDRFVNERDEAAFEVLVWRHGPMVLSVCRRVLRHEQDAEDAFQATFLTFVRRARSIAKRQAVASWLYKVAYRIALEAKTLALKRNAREKQNTGPLEAKGTQEPSDAAAWRDLRAVLDEEVNRLPDKYRTPLILCYFEGKTYEEVARELGCPKGTVSIRLMRARELLRPRLARRGLALSSGIFAAVLSENVTAAAVSKSLVEGTVKAALLFAAGKTAAGGLSGQAVTLAEGVLKSMLMTKLKVGAAILLVVGMAGSGASVLTYGGMTGEPTSHQAKNLFPADAVEPQEQKAKPVPPLVTDKEDKTKLEADRASKDVQRARTQFTLLLHVYEQEEYESMKVLIDARLRLMEKEEQLKRIERTQALDRDRDYAELKRWTENLKQIEHLHADKEHRSIVQARERLREVEEEFKKKEQPRMEEIAKARREFLTAEAEAKVMERLQAFKRERMVRRLEAGNEWMMHLEPDFPRVESAKQGRSELEDKVDRLLREVTELRREIRQQQTDKGQRQLPERHPDQP